MLEAPSFPGPHTLRAALEVARLIDPTGVAIHQLEESFLALPSGGIYRHLELQAGLGLLIDSGMAIPVEGRVHAAPGLRQLLSLAQDHACATLLGVLLAAKPPMWLEVARHANQLPLQLVPSSAARVLETLIPEPSRREAFLLALARRFDPAPLTRLRDLGEEFVAAECRRGLAQLGVPELANRVQRVSVISDELGYDVVTPTTASDVRRLEVKVQGRVASFSRVFISRNEAEYGLRDPTWALVVCQCDSAGRVRIVGWCSAEYLREKLPLDRAATARWVSTELNIPNRDLYPGLPLGHTALHE